MNLKFIAVSVLVSALVFMGGWAVVKPAPVNQIAGATPTLDGIDIPYTTIGGLKGYYISRPFEATTTYPCKFKNPYSGTSTLVYFGVSVATSTMGAVVVDVSTTSVANGFGSSTPTFVANKSTNGRDGFVWYPSTLGSTTPSAVLQGMQLANGTNYNIIAPNEYVVLRVATSSASAVANFGNGIWQGKCTAEFRALTS